MNKYLLLFSAITLSFLLQAQPQIELQEVGSGFLRPVDITNMGDERLFITQQAGLIRILYPETGDVLPTPFLDITDRVNSSGNERGLLGLAFHPDYLNNGYFYVNYTGAGGHTRIRSSS
jgi:glucose/arabinose dehydrogenase